MLSAPRAGARGFSLIEVLIAVLLLSIGLLGLAKLQTTVLQRGSSAAQRVDAINQAYDLLDRMRANRARSIAGDYDVAFDESPDGATLAETDVRSWKLALAGSLPGGDARVLVEDQVVTIEIIWTDASTANPGDVAEAGVTLRTQL
jgi:type IV pilus assembly protein PilV